MEERPREILDVERAVAYLRDVDRLWAESPTLLQREFGREVFQRIVVEGPEIVAITPRPMYAPLLVMDRRERFGGDFCRLAPRAVAWERAAGRLHCAAPESGTSRSPRNSVADSRRPSWCRGRLAPPAR